MAMANVANWLRLRGLRVAIVDWDLEAPGIESFLVQSQSERQRVRAASGLLDLLAAYKLRYPELPDAFFEELRSDDGGRRRVMPLTERSRLLERYLPGVASLVEEVLPESQSDSALGGPLHLLTPGVRDGDNAIYYAHDVQAFDWAGFYDDFDGAAFFHWLRSGFEASFDVTLIDSRTGITEIGGICTREMADLVVCLCAPNTQNLEGTALLVRSLFDTRLADARGGRRLRAAVVPARYDNSETDLLTGFQAEFFEVLRGLRSYKAEASWIGLEPDAMWALRLPYTPKYAYKEKLCVGAPDPNPDLLERYTALSRFIATCYLDTLPAEQLERTIAVSPQELAGLVSQDKGKRSLDAELDLAFSELSSDAQQAYMRIVSRLITFSDPLDTQSAVLRRWPVDALPEADREYLDEIVHAKLLAIVSARRSSPDKVEAFIRFPHEDALQEWARLRKWIEARSDFLRFRLELERYAREFAQSGGSRLPPTDLLEREQTVGRQRSWLLPEEIAVLEAMEGARRPPAPEKTVLASVGDPFASASAMQSDRAPIAEKAAGAAKHFSGRAFAVWLAVIGGGLLIGLAIYHAVGALGGGDVPTEQPDAGTGIKGSSPEQMAQLALTRGRLLEGEQDVRGALAAYTSAIELNANLKEALVGRGSLQLKTGLNEQAVADFQRARKLDPQDPSVYVWLGRALASTDQLDAANTELSNAIAEVSDRVPSLYLQRGRVLAQLERWDDALRDFRKSAELAASAGSPNPEAYYEQGVVLERKQDYEGAVSALSKALEQKPDYWGAGYERALAYAAIGQRKSAIEDLRRVVQETEDAQLREQAAVQLTELEPRPAAAPSGPTRVYMHYVDPRDKQRVEELNGFLGQQRDFTPTKVKIVPHRVLEAQVRCFFKADLKAATTLKDLLAKQLGRPIRVLELWKYSFPKAEPGTIEVWLPSLAAPSKQQQ